MVFIVTTRFHRKLGGIGREVSSILLFQLHGEEHRRSGRPMTKEQ
jgi:hypothetical protein